MLFTFLQFLYTLISMFSVEAVYPSEVKAFTLNFNAFEIELI